MRAVINDELEGACRKHKAIITDSVARDIQRTIVAVHKLTKAAKVEHTDGGFMVQTTPSPIAWNVTEHSWQWHCPVFNTTMLSHTNTLWDCINNMPLFQGTFVQERMASNRNLSSHWLCQCDTGRTQVSDSVTLEEHKSVTVWHWKNTSQWQCDTGRTQVSDSVTLEEHKSVTVWHWKNTSQWQCDTGRTQISDSVTLEEHKSVTVWHWKNTSQWQCDTGRTQVSDSVTLEEHKSVTVWHWKNTSQWQCDTGRTQVSDSVTLEEHKSVTVWHWKNTSQSQCDTGRTQVSDSVTLEEHKSVKPITVYRVKNVQLVQEQCWSMQGAFCVTIHQRIWTDERNLQAVDIQWRYSSKTAGQYCPKKGQNNISEGDTMMVSHIMTLLQCLSVKLTHKLQYNIYYQWGWCCYIV